MRVYIITLLLILGMSEGLFSQDKEIIYFGDPMCSWCYGFSKEVSKVKDAFPEFSFEMVMGGLRPYGTETMADLDGFLKSHWEEIGEKTGESFQYDILAQKDFVYDTEPACRAVVVMRDLKPGSELAFFKLVQRSFYNDNKDPKLVATYFPLLKEFGVEEKVFEEQWSSEAYKAKTKKDFQLSQQMGIRGYPSMVMKLGEQYYLLSNGYLKAETIIASVKNELGKL